MYKKEIKMFNKILVSAILASCAISASAQSYRYNQTTTENKSSAFASISGIGSSNAYFSSKATYVVNSTNTLKTGDWSAKANSTVSHEIVSWSSVNGNGTATSNGNGYTTILGKTATGFTDPSYSSSAVMAQVDMGTYIDTDKLQWSVANMSNQGAVLNFVGNTTAAVNVSRNESLATTVVNDSNVAVIAKQLILDDKLLTMGTTFGSFGFNNTTYGNTNDR